MNTQPSSGYKPPSSSKQWAVCASPGAEKDLKEAWTTTDYRDMGSVLRGDTGVSSAWGIAVVTFPTLCACSSLQRLQRQAGHLQQIHNFHLILLTPCIKHRLSYEWDDDPQCWPSERKPVNTLLFSNKPFVTKNKVFCNNTWKCISLAFCTYL